MQNKLKKIAVIVGPTATGKSTLAIQLAKCLGGELVSADSRQIYKDFDIGTGKEFEDLKNGSAEKTADGWIVDGIPIHLYDICEGNVEFSAARYAQNARSTIASIWQKQKLPILVGGTGFYIQATLHGIGTSGRQKNETLRNMLADKSTAEMQQLLSSLAPKRLATMNNSDRNNARRLQRQIELAIESTDISEDIISMYPYMKIISDNKETFKNIKDNKTQVRDPLFATAIIIGLSAPQALLEKRIRERVEKMFAMGLEEEIKGLLTKGFTFNSPGFRTIGYSEFAPHAADTVSTEKIKEAIVLHTIQYAKRQWTWFKRDKSIAWFSITDENFPSNLENHVQTWYHRDENSKHATRNPKQ